MGEVVLYHNPRCSKSREALDWLRQNGYAVQVVEYLKTPPDADTLARLAAMLGAEDVRMMMRRKEAAYRAADLDHPDLTQAALLAALAAEPVLLERPLAVYGGRAAIGRPLEKIAALVAEAV
ncbi:arsenate reductase (glutaredoxin) [Neisseria leonii]|uniref:Arsenate reductase n=1 Tax=Neisseria leonii TaxID=2995413 RepID=A0A9X4E7V8_9NEIS|nr:MULTISPECIES: arsenate reductase (glutaredoxin) [unclassified Neisseria]MDD9326543.1 arsenate reductase (glutaredoxin) [Neisseria sp. 3986]MDD9328652.1 arsenate reductase (glutaredoxin) [Neisseria sp. 51.81]